MSKVLMVMNKVGFGAGSTRTIMYRSKSLVEKGYEVSILTVKDIDSKKKEDNLRSMDRLDERVKVRNIYDDYQDKNTKKRVSKKKMKYYKRSTKINEKGLEVENNSPERTVWYFNNGKRVKRKKWKENGNLSFIDYYNENEKKIVRENFHEEGYVKKKTYYDLANGKRMHTQYFTPDGFCFLDSWSSKYMEAIKHFLFDRHSGKTYSFKKDDEFHTHWLEQVCTEQSQKPYVISDKRETASSIMNMDGAKAYRIYVIHRNHFKYPYKLGSPLKLKEKKVLDRINEHDQVVMLTEKQKNDIIEEFGDHGNISVIPHNIPSISNENIEKDDKTISMVARLHPTKQTKETVEAFQRVVQEIPDAKLELYGTGVLEKDLSAQIKNLKLEQNVILKGFAKNTDKVYQKSLATLLTSKYEAFSLVILESMFNGTPVISYDVNYGPSDIITNGEDGYLISQDHQILIDKILDLLKKPEKAHEMGKKAQESVSQKFNQRVVMDKWEALFDRLKKERS